MILLNLNEIRIVYHFHWQQRPACVFLKGRFCNRKGFCQNSGHGQKMDENFPHFPSKKAPLGVYFPHAPLVLKGAFPTFWEDFPLCPEF